MLSKVSYLPSGSFIICIAPNGFPKCIGKRDIEVKCREIVSACNTSYQSYYNHDNVHGKTPFGIMAAITNIVSVKVNIGKSFPTIK